MEFIAVAFRSRAHTVRFAEFMRKNGVYCQIINTPKEAGVGCGLSVRCDVRYLATVNRAVKLTGYDSFAGVFSVRIRGTARSVKSI